MSETWADAQFDTLEAAYDEVPIEAKARIAELERILDLDKLEIIRLTNEVDRRDALIRDMWEYLTGGTEYCLSCALRDGCDLDVYGDDCGMRGVFERRLREFGIGEKS